MNAPAIVTRTRLYMIFDTIALSIKGGIIQCENDEVARRAFYDALAAEKSPYASHPNDYELLYLGQLNSHGAITETDIDVVARGVDWVAANANKPTNLKIEN